MRLRLGRLGLYAARAERPARPQESNDQHREKSDDKFEGRSVGPRAREGRSDAGDLRHVRLEAVRWGLVGHKGFNLRTDFILETHGIFKTQNSAHLQKDNPV